MKIYGPAFDKEGRATGKLVEREVLEAELAAYEAIGYKQGSLTPELVAADKETTKAAEEAEKAKEEKPKK